MLAGLRPRTARAIDRALSLLAFSAMAVELLAYGGKGGDLARSLVAAALLAAPLVWWRARPQVCAVAVAAVLLVAEAGAAPLLYGKPATPFVPVIVSVFGLAAYGRGRFVVPAAVASWALLCATAILDDGSAVGDVAFTTLLVYAPTFVAGRVTRTRAMLNFELAAEARRLEAEREERAEHAAAEERARIAGELHDVVAHGVSSMVVQAAAARRLAPRDPAAAAQAIALIEDTGRNALEEMRRLLAVLRAPALDAPAPGLAPQPSLGRIGALVERARAAGRDVSLDVQGEPREVSAGLDMAAYRVVEEALAAAPDGPLRVAVRWGRGELELEIAAEAREGPAAGELVGLRERVALFGGDLAAGGGAGGYAVRARLPLAEAA